MRIPIVERKCKQQIEPPKRMAGFLPRRLSGEMSTTRSQLISLQLPPPPPPFFK